MLCPPLPLHQLSPPAPRVSFPRGASCLARPSMLSCLGPFLGDTHGRNVEVPPPPLPRPYPGARPSHPARPAAPPTRSATSRSSPTPTPTTPTSAASSTASPRKWPDAKDKCWAMFTGTTSPAARPSPMSLHGLELHRPHPPVQRLRLHDVQHDLRHQLLHLGRHGPEPQATGTSASHTVARGLVRRPLAHVRQLPVGHLHALRRQDHRRRRGHRRRGRLRRRPAAKGARPHRQVPLPQRHQPQRLPHRRRRHARARRGVPLLQPQRPQVPLLLQRPGTSATATSSTSATARSTRATTPPGRRQPKDDTSTRAKATASSHADPAYFVPNPTGPTARTPRPPTPATASAATASAPVNAVARRADLAKTRLQHDQRRAPRAARRQPATGRQARAKSSSRSKAPTSSPA